MEELKAEIMLIKQRVDQLEGIREDFEIRLRRLERNMFMGIGAICVLQLILKFIAK